MRGVAPAIIEQLLQTGAKVSSRTVAQAAGISRQAAHKWLREMVDRGLLAPEGKARAAKYLRAPPRRTLLAVATTGSSFRLSARLLLAEVPPGALVLDFLGCGEVGEEFLEEVFHVWAPQHPEVSLEVENFPAAYIAVLDVVLEHSPRRPGVESVEAAEPLQASTPANADWAAQ